ncbi:MAG TPA: D-glycero-beta-D-manno-heptose 1-phosphate adenylyltransferase [Cytophagales bacterium]|nr:D-glycero-beta-D-manno-heptose 1-phosphate adenylyltransferase [Cytophagales bacterium]
MNTSDKIHKNLDSLLPLVGAWKAQGHKIVFTNGCFDLLHLGHVDYLEKARNLGDKMVVGLNTDASVQGNKGTDRPITDEVSRARVLAALQFVDAVILFDEDTPYLLICQVQPDILVKGKDYAVKDIVGADFVMNQGGKVETIELVSGYSTSGIVNKIKKQK